jgi:hypothetical protein
MESIEPMPKRRLGSEQCRARAPEKPPEPDGPDPGDGWGADRGRALGEERADYYLIGRQTHAKPRVIINRKVVDAADVQSAFLLNCNGAVLSLAGGGETALDLIIRLNL